MDYDQLQKLQKSDQARVEEYLKKQISEIFHFASEEIKKGYIRKVYIPIIMRYLVAFPSDAQIADVIIPEIEDEEDSDYISYVKLEPYMLKVLREKEFEPDEPEILMAAFKLLDQEEKGYIEVEVIRNTLQKNGIEFNNEEIDMFVNFATNNDPNSKKFYYEDYVSRLYQVIDKQRDDIMKGLPNFVMPKNI